MTISGEISKKDLDAFQIDIFPAKDAQDYVVNLIPQIEKLDGAPVWFVHDGETQTSDDLITDFKESLWLGEPCEEKPIFKLLKKCFENNWKFRIWLAHNGQNDFIINSEPATTLSETLKALKEREGAYYKSKE